MENKKNANFILITGTLLNFFIGVLYAWGELKKSLMTRAENGGWEWSSTQAGFPYTLAIVCFAIAVVIGGRIQDKIGPRWVLTTGGFMVGLGLILSGLVGNNPFGVTLCFGVITGFGTGLCYSSVTPPALKWFHPSQKGMVNGFTVGGFGFAPILYAPLVSFLIRFYSSNSADLTASIEKTFLTLGISIILISVTVAQFIKNPPSGYTPLVPENCKKRIPMPTVDITWRDMIKTKTFMLMSIMFLFSATVGLMLIGNISKIAQVQVGLQNTAILLSLMAFVNGLGRLCGGILSDRVGRSKTLFIVLSIQMINMLGFLFYNNLPLLVLGVIIAGSCYGTFLSVFPSITGDQFGLKNFGVNYGIMLMFWGLAGVVAPLFADFMFDIHQNFRITYIACAAIMPVLIYMNLLLKKEIEK